MKRNKLTWTSSIIATILMSIVFCGCSGSPKFPSQFVGKWADQINRNQRVEVSIEKNGEYKVKITQTNRQGDVSYYRGQVVKVNDDVIKLPSASYMHDANNQTAIVQAHSRFFLRSDGAFSNTEVGLERPYGYLVKLNDD